jgi:methylphosphotriester-DNA--protein-cysteine methyltransferase
VVREVFAQYPALRELWKLGFEQLILATLRFRLQAGECVEHVARDCGLSLFKIRVLLKAHPDLQRRAQQNRFEQGVERLGGVFQLVEHENLSVWNACRHVGLACNRSTYTFARTTMAQERYPRLRQYFSQTSPG